MMEAIEIDGSIGQPAGSCYLLIDKLKPQRCGDIRRACSCSISGWGLGVYLRFVSFQFQVMSIVPWIVECVVVVVYVLSRLFIRFFPFS